MGWKCFEDGERDVDELGAAAVEAIEGDVADHDVCTVLSPKMQEVFDQVGVSELVLGPACHGP